MPNLFWKEGFQYLGLLVIFVCSPALAGLNVTDLKDLRQNVRLQPEFSYLDPVHAFNLSRQGLLINAYNYPKSHGKGKVDAVDDLIQNLFNAANGTDNPVFFQVSPLSSKFGRFLAPKFEE